MAKRVALALGSGGARGYAHIGVLNELGRRGYDVVGIAGSSMGALVGGLFAAGNLDEFTEWATTLTGPAMLRLLDPSISASGVFRASKILDAVREILGEVTIEDLPFPYTAVTTDLIAGRSVWLQRGPLDEAIRASIAIPGVIAPHVLDGRMLADGGILDPLPIAPIAGAGADFTVAVSVSGMEADVSDDGEGAGARPTRERLNRLRRSTSALLDRFNIGGASLDINELDGDDPADDDELTDNAPGAAVPKLRSFAVMMRTIDIAQAALARHQMAAYPPDVLIEVPRTACRSLDFHRATELIDLGRELAARALDRFDGADAGEDLRDE
ncbi:MAG: patatin-like phospholipase family protein [Mycobacteriaceae bacterium]